MADKNQYLDKAGLDTLVTQLKTKLDSKIDTSTNAEENQNAFSNVAVGSNTLSADTKTDTLTITSSGAITVTGTSSNDTVDIGVKVATDDQDGVMTAADHKTLSGLVSTGGEVNQNAVSNVKIYTTTTDTTGTNVAMSAKTDTFNIKAGNNITLTADVTNKSVTIAGSAEYTLPTANASTKGGVTLSDSTSSSSGVSGGVAATPAAVKAAYDLANGKVSPATLDSYVLKTDVGNIYTYKGVVENISELNALTGMSSGDTYYVNDAGMNYIYNGTSWDDMGEYFKIESIPTTYITGLFA